MLGFLFFFPECALLFASNGKGSESCRQGTGCSKSSREPSASLGDKAGMRTRRCSLSLSLEDTRRQKRPLFPDDWMIDTNVCFLFVSRCRRRLCCYHRLRRRCRCRCPPSLTCHPVALWLMRFASCGSMNHGCRCGGTDMMDDDEWKDERLHTR